MKKIIALLFVSSIVLFGCSGSGSSYSSNNPEPTNTSTEPTSTPTNQTNMADTNHTPLNDPATSTLQMGKNVLTMVDGTYTIGSDIPADEYFIIAGGPTVPGNYVIKDSPDGQEVSSGNVDPNGTFVTLTDGQTIRIKDAIMYPKATADFMENPTYYNSGTYYVGSDIDAGNYSIGSDEEFAGGSYVISSDAAGNEVIDSGDIGAEEEIEIQLEDGQYITLDGLSMINMDNIIFINY